MAKGLPRSTSSLKAVTNPLRVIPIRNAVLNVAAAGAGIGFGSVVVGDFLSGDILLLGASCNLQITTASANITNATLVYTFSVGTAPTVAGALTTNEADVIQSTATGAATAKLSPLTRGRTANTSGLLTNNASILDNQNGSLELNLSCFVAAADITDATNADLIVNGYLSVAYLVL